MATKPAAPTSTSSTPALNAGFILIFTVTQMILTRRSHS